MRSRIFVPRFGRSLFGMVLLGMLLSALYAGNELTTDNWFPWYDGGVNMNTWVMIGTP